MIVDHILVQGVEPQNWLTECLDLLVPYTVYFIGVHCSVEELRRRAQVRGTVVRDWQSGSQTGFTGTRSTTWRWIPPSCLKNSAP